MQARRMQRDPITWAPTHALVITTNNQPVVRATDHGAWRRLAKVVFPLRYRNPGEPLEGPDDRCADTRLRARMEAQDPTLLEAVLAWLLDGARRWYAADRVMPALPARVQEDTRAWRGETDLILQFIDDCLILEPDGLVLSTDVYEEFTAWLEADGHRPWAANVFKTRLLEHPAAQAVHVTTSKTRDRTNLSRPQRKAHMIIPGGPVAVLHNVRFCQDDERHLRMVHNPRQEQLAGLFVEENPT